MATTFNGWPVIDYPRFTGTFVAPNGKTVYTVNPDVATIFEYVARQWHERIEPLPAATDNEYPGERTGYIVIHAQRPYGTSVGTGSRSNHVSGTAMDILGDKHPYEATNPPHLRYGGYDDGFTTRQRNELVKIRNEIGKARGRWVLRLGIHFPIGLRDGMHCEIAPGVSAADVAMAADRLRASEVIIDLTEIHRQLLALGYSADEAGVRAFQSDHDDWGHNLTVDGIPGDKTQRALGEAVSKIDDLYTAVRNVHRALDRVHDDMAKRTDATPGAVWAHRNPAHSGNRDAHGLLRDAATAKTHARNAGVLSAAQIADKPEQEES